MTKVLKMEVADDALNFMIDQNFPDFRGALQTIQRLHRSETKKVTIEDVKKKSYEFRELYDLILDGGKPEDVHTILMGDYTTKSVEVLTALDNNFIDYIKLSRTDFFFMIPHIVINICRYQNMLHTVIDPAICMKAAVYSLMAIADNNRPK